jgi:hypothetical protein
MAAFPLRICRKPVTEIAMRHDAYHINRSTLLIDAVNLGLLSGVGLERCPLYPWRTDIAEREHQV